MKRINSNYCVFVIILTQLTSFIPMGLQLAALNPSAKAIENFANDTIMLRYNVPATTNQLQLVIALAQSFLNIGSLIGSATTRWTFQLFSRRRNITIAHVLAVIGAILMSPVAKYGPSYEALIVGRMLTGISRGMLFTQVSVFVAETTNRQSLALFQSPPGWLLQMGSAIGNGIAHPDVLGGDNTWPYLMAVPALFSIVYLSCLPWLPQTPTYLILQEKNLKETENIDTDDSPAYLLLRKLRYGNTDTLLKEYKSLKEEIKSDLKIEKASFWKILSTSQYRRQLFGAIVLLLCVQVSGFQAILQYTDNIFEAAGINEAHSTFFTIGFFSLFMVLTMLCSSLLPRFGSRRLTITGLCIVFFSLILLTVSTVTSSSVPNMSYVSVASLAIYVIGSASGPLVSFLALPSEITTQTTRPIVLWVAGMCFWTFAFSVSFVTPYALNAIGGYFYLVFVFLVFSELIYIYCFVPQTHNRSVAEIQKYFQKKKHSKTSPSVSYIQPSSIEMTK